MDRLSRRGAHSRRSITSGGEISGGAGRRMSKRARDDRVTEELAPLTLASPRSVREGRTMGDDRVRTHAHEPIGIGGGEMRPWPSKCKGRQGGRGEVRNSRMYSRAGEKREGRERASSCVFLCAHIVIGRRAVARRRALGGHAHIQAHATD